MAENNELAATLQNLLSPLGLEVVEVEAKLHAPKTLRVFIDFLPSQATQPPPEAAPSKIGIEDCVRATKLLDEALDPLPEIENLFKGPYELEVSSPGIDRPLKKAQDFTRFKGERVLVHTFRPLTSEESANPTFSSLHPKQKNFIGTLADYNADLRAIEIEIEEAKKRKPGSRVSAKKPKPSFDGSDPRRIRIPLELVSKANLCPELSQTFNQNSQNRPVKMGEST